MIGDALGILDAPRPAGPSTAEARVAALRARRARLILARNREQALERLCEQKRAEHEAAVRGIDAEVDVIDEELFERWRAAP